MMNGSAKGRGTPPTPEKLVPNAPRTGVELFFQSKSGHGSLINAGNSPHSADSTSKLANPPNIMEDSGEGLGSPLRMTPRPAKQQNSQSARTGKSQPPLRADTSQPQGTKRTVSCMTGDNISKNMGDFESTTTEDDKSGSQSSRKRVRVDNNEDEERIGSHVDIPELAVYASYKNALLLRIHPEEAAPEVLERLQSKISRVVTIDKVVLDAKILGRSADEFEAMSSEQKKGLLKSHLKSKEDSSVSHDETEAKIKMESTDSKGLLVGYRTEDPDPKLNNVKIPVYASLTNHKTAPALKFRCGREEARESKIQLEHQSMLHFNQITFLPDFDKGDEKPTKDFIKSVINRIEKVPIRKVDIVNVELQQALEAHEASGKELSEKIHNYVVARDKAGLEDKIMDQAATIKRLETNNYAQNETINKQISDITKKDHKIADLEKQLQKLTAHVEELSVSRSTVPSNKLVVSNRTFEKFPTGNVNAGLYVSKQPQVVTVSGSDYYENTALSEFKNLELGGNLTESTTQNGIPFNVISGGENNGKLVQELGPHSIFQHEGRFFVRWHIRTKKELSL